MKNFSSKTLLPLLAAAALAPNAFADNAVATGVSNALSQSKVNVSFRGRYEGVKQDGKDNANALTVRSRLTVNTGIYDGFSLGVQVDNTTAFDHDYNDLSLNYVGNDAVIADAEYTEVNQAYLKYSKNNFSLKAGRQRINLGEQRFIGSVGWRQNEQTYDGYRFQYKASEKLNFDYIYVYNVNRIFGPDSKKPNDLRGNIHLSNVDFELNKDHKFSAFAYLLDFDTAAALSSSTYGMTYHGKFGPVKVNATYATQSDYGDNPNNYSANYYHVEAATKVSKVILKTGVEVRHVEKFFLKYSTVL